MIRVSYDRATTKGGHENTVPIADPLLPYIVKAMKSSGRYLFSCPRRLHENGGRGPTEDPEDRAWQRRRRGRL